MRGSLILDNNTMVNAADGQARFVHVWVDRLAGPTPVQMRNNLFVGAGQLDMTPAQDRGGNQRIDRVPLALPTR